MSYTPTTSTLSGVGSALLSSAGPVGSIASGVLSVFSSFAKGPTAHLDFGRATNLAIQFVGPPGGVWPMFQKAFSYDELQRIALYVVPRFDSAFQNQWGTDTSQNQAFKNNIDSQGQINNALNNQLVVFMQWVATNVDQNRLQDEFNHVVPTYFDAIFLGAISDAGLDPARLGGGTALQQVVQNPTNPGGVGGLPIPTIVPVTPQSAAGLNVAGSASTILFIGVILGGLYLFMKGRKK